MKWLRTMTLLVLLLALATIRAAGDEQAALSTDDFDRYLIAPLHVHLLVSTTEPALCTTLTDADLERIVAKVNRVWSQAGIAFFVEKITREEPAPLTNAADATRGDLHGVHDRLPAASRGGQSFDVYYIKEFDVNGVCYPTAIVVKDTASLRPVEGGIDEPIPRVTSHELGHALGLPHRQDRTNLMASGTTGTSLNAAEVERARATAAKDGRFVTAPELLGRADVPDAREGTAAARESFQTVLRFPVTSELVRRLRERPAR